MKLVKPDYNNSIVSVTNSILKFYGVSPFHKTHKTLDSILSQQEYKHVIYVLMDGFGVNLLKTHLDETSSLKEHFVMPISSVFPPTTVAATNAVLSGLHPIETGYIGWVQYFKQEQVNNIVFLNQDFYDNSKKIEGNLQAKYLYYKDIYKLIKEASPQVKTMEFFPAFRPNGSKTFSDQVDRVIHSIYEHDETFSYVYWTDPDLTEHVYGVTSIEVQKVVLDLDKQFQKLVSNIKKDTIVIAIADHGLTDITEVPFLQHQELIDLLETMPSIEPRATSFFVKKGKKRQFKKLFQALYKEQFKLYSHHKFLRSGLLGNGTKHNMVDEFIGDFMAISKGTAMFKLNDSKGYIAHHAGLTEEEMIVPLIVAKKD